MKDLKVALVHDYLREYGGAERVVEALHEMFPDAPVYTAFVDKDSLGVHWKKFENWDIRESIASRIPFIKKLYSPLRLFSAYFFESFDFSEYDVVISSTNMYMAKAVLTNPSTLHICYCHTPPRSLYGYSTASNWKKNILTRTIGELINFKMRQVDFFTAQRPDLFVANSEETRKRIYKYYKKNAVILYPPVEQEGSEVQKVLESDPYYLYVNRLVFAKHPEIALLACKKLGVRLKVVGSGPMESSLQSVADKNIEFLGAVDDTELGKLYSGATALLYPVEDEDFGIVPVESMMHGVPVIAHNSGGPIETIKDGSTGILFDALTVEGLCEAIHRFEKTTFDREKVRKHALKFSKKRFQDEMEKLVVNEVKKIKK